MSDLTIRLIVVAAAVLLVLVAMATRRGKATSRPPESIDLSDEGPGVVVFTSTSCGTCEDTVEAVTRVFGEGGFRERAWERDADLLTEAGVDEVPLTVVLDRKGRVRTVLRGTPSVWRLRWERLRGARPRRSTQVNGSGD